MAPNRYGRLIRIHAVVTGAVGGELDVVRNALSNLEPCNEIPWPAELGLKGALRILVLETGPGPVNAGAALAAVLARHRPRFVLTIGCGGAYPGADLSPGDLALATEEIYGDLGIQCRQHRRDFREIGIPLWTDRGIPRFQRIPLDRSFGACMQKVLRKHCPAHVPILPCPFLTVSLVSGDHWTAEERRDRFSVAVENMEGAAAAHVSAMYGVPFAELRGISNLAGDRDKRNWTFESAVQRCQEAALRLLEATGAG